MQYFYDRGLIYYALSNPDMGSCYEISSFLLSRCNKEKKNCILEKKTRDTFDGKQPIDFAKKYKRKKLATWIKAQL